MRSQCAFTIIPDVGISKRVMLEPRCRPKSHLKPKARRFVTNIPKPIVQLLLILILLVVAPTRMPAEIWTVLAGDPPDDGNDSSLGDAAQLCYQYDKEQDLLWFRVSLFDAPNAEKFGVNLVVDTGGDEATKMNWWGANKAFKFDKLVTVWVTRTANGYQGTIGVADTAGVKEKHYTNLSHDNVQIRVEGRSFLLGIKRKDITDKMKFNLIAAVGSNERWNDDVPGVGSTTLDLGPKPKRGLREIDLSRNNLELPADYKTLPDDAAPVVEKKGKGTQALILIPGMYSGLKSFDGFIARNEPKYKFYVLTPPGLNGTPARAMPGAGTSFTELTWTRHLERNILDLIKREKLIKPLIIAGQMPASVAAIELAEDHPEEIGGVVLVGAYAVQFVFSPKDPARKTPATPEERARMVDYALGATWFKFVTPETWLSNDFPPESLSADLAIGQQASNELEAAPLPVKIRYLCEFSASDVTRKFDKLSVPILALIPGFDDKFLADPANSGMKTAYIDRWENLSPKPPKLQLAKIPNARVLVLDDQPKQADDAVVKFVDQIVKGTT
jgi:pimeloyl-ACP methyl ester carboxylesterase